MQIFYNLFIIPLLYVGFHFAGLFNQKIRKGIVDRKNLFQKLKQDIEKTTGQKIWFHISSYGEFEQAKPVLKKLKETNPELFILVSFFSPSAYDNIKLAQPIDAICYLPFDSIFNAKRFISLVNPVLAVVVRHDIWPNFLWMLNKKKIPTVLIDASIPKHSSRLWPLFRPFNRKLYNRFDHILPISEEEHGRIGALISDDNKLFITGDTKFDQVYQRTLEKDRVKDLSTHPYLKGKRIWIVGSSWAEDEARIIPAFSELCSQIKDLLLIIVPHEPSELRVREIEHHLNQYEIKSIIYSNLTVKSSHFKAMIVDKMGFLANIYSIGFVAFVGGSYEQNVHNVLEPAAHGIPVLFGPKIHTQPEAKLLVQNGAGFIVETSKEIVEKVNEFVSDSNFASQCGEKASEVVKMHSGATDKTIEILLKYLRAN